MFEVTGPGTIAGTVTIDGAVYNVWHFSVIIDGHAGIVDIGALPDVDYQSIVDYLNETLEQGTSILEGVVLLDPDPGDPGDGRGDPGDDRGDDDDDSAVASSDDGDGNGDEFGDSV